MRARRRLRCAMLGMLIWWPAWAEAQTPAVELPIAIGQKVRVTSADGKVTTGTIQALTPVSFEIGEGTARASLAMADVRRIQVPDSVTNGVVIGALSLGLVGAIWGATGDALGDAVVDVANLIAPAKGDDSNHALTFAVGGAAAGALLGYALDSAKMKTIYRREHGGVSVGVRPIVSAVGKGAGVSVRW